MPYGVLPTGFSRKTVDVIKSELESALLAEFPGVNLTAESVLGQLVGIMSTKLGEVWEAQEAFASNADPASAIGSWLRTIGSYTGVTPLPASKSYARLTVTLAPGYTLPAGSIVASNVNASVRFFTRSAVTNSGVAIAGFAVDADCEVYGPVTALSGELNVCVSPTPSITTIINAVNLLDATPGRFAESDYDFRARRLIETSGQGSRTLDAIRVAVLRVAGVISCSVRENSSDVVSGTMEPHSVSVVVYDGTSPQASDADIARAIDQSKARGIYTNGDVTQSVSDSEGVPHVVNFYRATVLPLWLRIVVRASGDSASMGSQIRDKVVAWCDANIKVGDDVIMSRLCQPIFAVSGVQDILGVYVGTTSTPTQTTNFSVSEFQIADFDTSRVTVEVQP